MKIRITEPNEKLVAYSRSCWVNHIPFYFHHEPYELVFFEITRNADDTVKRIDFELMEQKP